MFERLNDSATKVMALAHEEAAHYHHQYIGTEHILLGVAEEGKGAGAVALKGFGIDLSWIRPAVEKLSEPGPDTLAIGENLPQTPRVKKVVECAFEEARGLNHSYVGTEHLLIGLLRVREGVAARVLVQFGLSTESVRQAVIDLVGLPAAEQPKPAAPPPPPANSPPVNYSLPSRIGEAWVNIIIGGILLFMMPRAMTYFLSFIHLAQAPVITLGDQIIPYMRSVFFLPDLGVDVSALVLILGGLIFLLVPRRPMLIAVAVLTAAAVLLNLAAIVVEWSQGFQIICALAVAFGGYQCIYLIGALRDN